MNLKQVQKKFGTHEKCVSYLEKLRWGKTVRCAYCESTRVIKAKSEKGRYKCYDCNKSFSVLVGTIFQDSKLKLNDWFLITVLVLNAKMGISSKAISRQTGIPLKTCWLTSMKIRCAMIDKKTELHGVLQMDESYFGSSPEKKITKNTPLNSPVLSTVYEKRGRGTKKTAVVGIVETGGSVKTKIIDKLTTRNLMAMLKKYVKTDESVLVTDGFRSYAKMDEAIEHITVKHKEKTKGGLNTNTIEGYWSIIKNGIKGNYRALSKKYLPFYLVEYDYKYNRRNKTQAMFEEFIANALTDESCMLNYKPIGDTKEVIYG
ncbi:MAG: IS1595 family transposase [Bacteroidetes bacterium]|nr:IS1595 family transposase [Bacteroidota bacterium]